MNISDLKIYLLNLSTLAISMSQADMILKITLLGVSIGYTAHKWWLLTKNKKKAENNGSRRTWFMLGCNGKKWWNSSCIWLESVVSFVWKVWCEDGNRNGKCTLVKSLFYLPQNNSSSVNLTYILTLSWTLFSLYSLVFSFFYYKTTIFYSGAARAKRKKSYSRCRT